MLPVVITLFLCCPALARLRIVDSSGPQSLIRSGSSGSLHCDSNQPWFICIWKGPNGLAITKTVGQVSRPGLVWLPGSSLPFIRESARARMTRGSVSAGREEGDAVCWTSPTSNPQMVASTAVSWLTEVLTSPLAPLASSSRLAWPPT